LRQRAAAGPVRRAGRTVRSSGVSLYSRCIISETGTRRTASTKPVGRRPKRRVLARRAGRLGMAVTQCDPGAGPVAPVLPCIFEDRFADRGPRPQPALLASNRAMPA